MKALRVLARNLGVSPDYLETGHVLGERDRRELALVDAELQLRLSDEPAAAEEAFRRIYEEAVAAGDLDAATRAQTALGLVAARQGQHRRAAALLEQARASGQMTPVTHPDVYAALGRAYAAEGKQVEAAELWQRCLDEVRAETPDDLAAQTRFATYLSYALADLGEFERAQELLHELLPRAVDLADPYTHVRLYWGLARLTALQEQPARALHYGQRAIALLEATEDTLQLARAHLLCAGILNMHTRAQQALPHLEAAERVLVSRADAVDVASLRTEQARAAVQLERAEDAEAYAKQALALLEQGDPAEQASARAALAEALLLRGDSDAALEQFARAVELFATEKRWQDAARASRSWARLLREAGRVSEAVEVLDRAADFAGRSPAPTRR